MTKAKAQAKKKAYVLAAGLAAAVMVAAAVPGGEARAADGKWYPGIICTKDTTRGTWSRWFGTVANISTTQGLDLTCPLVRDGTSITSASVQVFSRSTVQDGFPGCELHFEFASGSSVFGSSDFQVAPTVNSANVQTINYGAQSVSGGDYYYGVCFLPRTTGNGTSHVVRWGVTEP